MLKKYVFALMLVSLSAVYAEDVTETVNPEVRPSRNSVRVSPNIYYFKYSEQVPKPTKSDESALLGGLQLDYTHRFDGGWGLSVIGDITVGQKTYYDGTNQTGTMSITGDHDHAFVDLELLASKRIGNQGPGFQITPYGGLSFNYWYRDLRGVGRGGYREYYRWVTLPLGAEAAYQFNGGFRVAADASLRLNAGGRITAVLSDFAPGAPDFDGTLGAAIGGRLKLSASYQIANWFGLELSPYFEFRPIGEGSVSMGLQEPASTTYIVGSLVTGRFNF